MPDKQKSPQILVINTTFPEVNHLAAALAKEQMLSKLIRPYANMGRQWEKNFATIPSLGRIYDRTLGRRKMPQPLSPSLVNEAAIIQDLAFTLHHKLPIQYRGYHDIEKKLIYALNNSIARAGAKHLTNESMVVSSWHVAHQIFEKAKQMGVTRILNYPLAHHQFTHDYLAEEAEREPGFAATLNGHKRPDWETARLNHEIQLADKILVGSSFVKKTFITAGIPATKLLVIPYGVDISLFSPSSKPFGSKHFDVLFVGQLSQRKGISYLLRAYEVFKSAKTSLTLIGQLQDDGSALKPWQHLFTHIPHIPRSELARYFQQADVMVFPTLVEGMGLVVIEAMACGLPVITTSHGPGDIVRDGIDGFLIPPRDETAITEKLELLKSDPELKQWMGNNARQRAKEYSWNNYHQRVVAMCKKLL